MTIDPDKARPTRVDAVRNRERILEAAEAVFSAEGVSVPIDMVAERAEVGVGTVYRHFPTKEDLFEAIVMTRLEDLLALARSEASAESPSAALFSYLQEFSRQASAKHDLFDAMGAAGIDFKARCAEKVGEMKQRLGLLLTRAQDSGVVRQRHLGRRAHKPRHRNLPGSSPGRTRRQMPVGGWWESSVTASAFRTRPADRRVASWPQVGPDTKAACPDGCVCPARCRS